MLHSSGAAWGTRRPSSHNRNTEFLLLTSPTLQEKPASARFYGHQLHRSTTHKEGWMLAPQFLLGRFWFCSRRGFPLYLKPLDNPSPSSITPLHRLAQRGSERDVLKYPPAPPHLLQPPRHPFPGAPASFLSLRVSPPARSPLPPPPRSPPSLPFP